MDIESEGWSKILQIFPEMDFNKEVEEKPELGKYLRGAINIKSLGIEDPFTLSGAPKLDTDFSKILVLNGLPLCDQKKAEKLKALLIKLFGKRNFTITEESITMNFNEEGTKTTGQTFIKMRNEEQAKIAAAVFNGHKLDSKHTFSSCTLPEFDKIMAIEEPEETGGNQTNFLELKAPVLETTRDQYCYQQGKQVSIDGLYG